MKLAISCLYCTKKGFKKKDYLASFLFKSHDITIEMSINPRGYDGVEVKALAKLQFITEILESTLPFTITKSSKNGRVT